MAKEGLEGRTVTLKLKTVQFEIVTRATTVPNHAYIYKAADISKHALPLLEKVGMYPRFAKHYHPPSPLIPCPSHLRPHSLPLARSPSSLTPRTFTNLSALPTLVDHAREASARHTSHGCTSVNLQER